MFVTLLVGWLNLETLEFCYASGGHTPPSLLRDGQAIGQEQEDGPALGLMEDLSFPLNRLQLQAGDVLAVFTDGIDEAFNADQQQFGFDAFNQVLASSSGQSLEATGQALLEAVDTHQGEVPQSDDITLLLLQPRRPGSDRSRIRLDNDAGAVSTLQAWMGQLMGEAEIGAVLQSEMKLIAEEVITNVFKYGQLSDAQGVSVGMQLLPGQLVLEFRDPGIAFDPLAEAQRAKLGDDIDAAVIGGLGVHLLEALTDEQYYERVGEENYLRLVKLLA